MYDAAVPNASYLLAFRIHAVGFDPPDPPVSPDDLDHRGVQQPARGRRTDLFGRSKTEDRTRDVGHWPP